MRQLLRDHAALPLLPGHFPVPVEYDGTWWHSLGTDPGRGFVAATAELADQFGRLALRHRAARTAVAGAPVDDIEPPPPW